MTLNTKLEELKNYNKLESTIYAPMFYNIREQEGKEALEQLLSKKTPVVNDCIHSQLQDLIKLNYPQTNFTDDTLSEKISQHLGSLSILEYGVWVYYPWSNRLNHILDKEEFIAVRTSRNMYKITPRERTILSTKKIGIIGLSVGQSVSVTLAMERIAGELRLADFDVLELTNLNRIRTGIHNLGIPKVYSVAREISEIDPYIKVDCYPEGINEENIDQFFTKGGNLDLLVEESDGFDIKILSRIKARELKIPVIMEASDRCMVDVERFDLEPKRDILHGLVNHLDLATLKKLKTNEEKIPYMLDIIGANTISLRAKASMLEIGESICTWPQLASAVALGGGITADVSRRLLLNYFTDSGRYYIDVEQLIKNENEEHTNVHIDYKFKKEQNNLEEIQRLIVIDSEELQKSSVVIPESDLRNILEVAITAPSGGNAQPWLWYSSNSKIYLVQDVSRSSSLLDYNYNATKIALGAVIENFILAAQKFGWEVNCKYYPVKSSSRIIASFSFYKQVLNELVEPKDNDNLFDGIKIRITNRNIEQRVDIEKDQLEKLKNVAKTIDGCELKLITELEPLKKLTNIIAEVEKLRIMHPEGHQNFIDEMRWTNKENELTKDGIDINTCDLSNSELAGFRIARDKNVIEFLNSIDGGKAFEKLSRKSTLNASALGLVMMPNKSDVSFVNGGRAVQKIWIKANLLNISFQPQSPCTFLFSRLIQGNGIGLDANLKVKLVKLREEFKNIFEIKHDDCGEIFLFRLFSGKKEVVKSLRRNLNDVYKIL
jgi:tRNA A37 threonylcarbamoyladenosine dehydratase